MANDLAIGQGGPAAPLEPKTNGLEVKAQPRPRSGMLKHFGTQQDAAAARFEKLREAKTQINAVLEAFGNLTDLQDTVQVRDVVKASGGIVAAGVPATQMAVILADMPEQPTQLQAWIKDQFDKAQSAEQKINEGLAITRHGLVTSALTNLMGHGIEDQMMRQQPVGSA